MDLLRRLLEPRPSFDALLTCVQNATPQPPYDSESRISTLLHFEAMRDASRGHDKTDKLLNAKAKHDVFTAQLVAQATVQLDSFFSPRPVSALATDTIVSSPAAAAAQAPSPPLTLLILRACPEHSTRLFGTLVFALRLQAVLTALLDQTTTSQNHVTLVNSMSQLSKAGAHLAMTYEFDNAWLAPLQIALREFDLIAA
jgi:hypothetical protein